MLISLTELMFNFVEWTGFYRITSVLLSVILTSGDGDALLIYSIIALDLG